MVLQKELHECQNHFIQKGHNGTCKFGFPYSPHIEHNSFLIKKKTNGNTIDHNMKIEMLCHIIQRYYSFREHI